MEWSLNKLHRMTQILWDRIRGEQLEKLTVTGKKWQDGNGGGCSSSSNSSSRGNSSTG
jgi:hypothetical protein